MSTLSVWLLIAGSAVVYSAIAGIVFHVTVSCCGHSDDGCELIPAMLWPMVLVLGLVVGPAWAANKGLMHLRTKPKAVKPKLPKASIHKP